MLSFIFGGADGGASVRILSLIRSRLGKNGNMVLLTPEQHSHRAERELAAFCGPSACLYAEVLSFTRMYSRVAAQTGGLADVIPDKGARLLLLNLALDAAASKLRYYGDRSRRTELLVMLSEAIEELDGSMISTAELMAAAEETGGTIGDKLYDMAILSQAYKAYLAGSAGDSRDKILRLAEGIYNSRVGSGGVYIDGFTDFTEAELKVIDELLRRGTDITVSLVLKSTDEHFRLTENTYHTLAALAHRRGVSVRSETAKPAGSPAVNYFAQALFDYKVPPYEGEAPAELYKMSSVTGECRLAAARILEMMRSDAGLRYSDFVVVAADYEAIRPCAESVFGDYEIPFYSGEKGEFREKSLMAFVLEALEIVRGGWSYRNMFRYLKTGLAGLESDSCDMLENYCLMWGISGAMWTDSEPWDMNPRGMGLEKSEADQALLDRINQCRLVVSEPLKKLSEGLTAARTAQQQAAALYAFLESVELSKTLEEKALRLSGAGMAGEAAEGMRLWDILIDCLEQFSGILADAHMEADELRPMLELLLSVRDIGSIPPTLDSVTLVSPAGARSLKPRCMIILGANDVSLPGSTESRGIFSPDERRQLFDMGIKLIIDRDEGVTRQLHGLYCLAGAPAERLIISFSGGRDSRPSILMTRAASVFNINIIDESELDGYYLAAAPTPCISSALSGNAEAEACADMKKLAALKNAAGLPRGSLSSRSVNRIYGETFRLTATRAENFSLCRFMYFMQYGLKAAARKKASFDPPQLGTFVHYVLENTARQAKERGGFKNISDDELRELTDRFTREYTKQFFSSGEMKNARFAYLFSRLRETVGVIVADVAAELRSSSFEPLDFELQFADGADMPPAEVGSLKIIGTVDRVDGWLSGDKLYLRVADYKTGKKQFSLSDVWYGRGIQMLIYLFMLAEQGKARYGKDIVPAGILYSPARDILLSMPRSASDEEIAAKRADTLRRSGLILSDEQVISAMENSSDTKYIPVKFKDGVPSGSLATAAQLGDLSRYVKKLLEDMGDCLRRGSIDANPLIKGRDEGPCAFCPYTEACGFDGARDSARAQINIRPADFWRNISDRGGELNG